MTVPYSFGTATSAIPLSQLDSNFNTPITLGNTAIQLGNTVTTLNNMTLANVTISSGSVTLTGATVTNANVTGVLTLSNLTASTALALDASKNVVSVTNTGTGNNVLSASPTLTGTIGAAALTLSSDLTLSGGTANGVLYLNGSKVATSGSALTFNGTSLGVGSSAYGDAGTISLSVGVAGTTTGGLQLWSTTTGSHTIQWGDGTTGSDTYRGAIEYAHNGDTMRFYTSSTEQMRLTSTGLGIGTSSPLAKVDTGASTGQKVLTYSSSNTRYGLGVFTDEWRAFASTGASLTFGQVSSSDGSTYTERMRIDSSGNLGLGVTPSAWASYKAIQFGPGTADGSIASAGNDTNYSTNAYYNSGWKYQSTGYSPARYNQTDGKHIWYTAASGTAGNAITFTQAMTLDASGNLLVGKTSSTGVGTQNFEIKHASSATMMVSGGSYDWSMLVSSSTNALRFYSSSTELMRLDAAGNLGLGVTPSAWASGYKVFDIGNAAVHYPNSASQIGVSANAYFNGSSWLYKASANATLALQNAGQHIWYTAASGTAGNAITFTQAMTLDASGNLGVGTTSPSSLLHVSGSGTLEVARFATTTDNTPSIGIYSNGSIRAKLRASSAETALLTQGALPLLLGTNDTERARITSGGYSKFSNDGNYSGSTATYHEFYQSANSTAILVRATNASYSSSVLEVNGDRTTTNASYNLINAYNGAFSGQFIVRDSGNAVNTNNSYGSISDVKLKENITDATPKLADLMRVRIRNYNLKSDPEHKQIGVIAQELEQVFPGMIEESQDKDADGNDLGTTTKQVKYSVFVPMLIKAMQEQQAIIEQLKARLDAANL